MAKTLNVERGSVVKLARLCNCTEQTVRNALRSVTVGGDAERIRVEAVKRGYAIKKRPLTIDEYNRSYKEEL
ncbi:MAG: helix-turn-helix domain-containing protein [Bacteroides sp.]|jgi:hypothetical protein|nr:helix-turn-helix domain-containing protein [Bacteroides sp.]